MREKREGEPFVPTASLGARPRRASLDLRQSFRVYGRKTGSNPLCIGNGSNSCEAMMNGRLSAGLSRRSMIRVLVTGAGLLTGAPLLVSGALAKPAKKDSTQPKQLKPGQFEWRPDRAPAGPVAIIVSIPKQRFSSTAMVSRLASRPARPGRRATKRPRACSRSCRRQKSTIRAPMMMRRCPIWSGSPGTASHCMPASCPAIPPRMAASACHRRSPRSSTTSPRSARP